MNISVYSLYDKSHVVFLKTIHINIRTYKQRGSCSKLVEVSCHLSPLMGEKEEQVHYQPGLLLSPPPAGRNSQIKSSSTEYPLSLRLRLSLLSLRIKKVFIVIEASASAWRKCVGINRSIRVLTLNISYISDLYFIYLLFDSWKYDKNAKNLIWLEVNGATGCNRKKRCLDFLLIWLLIFQR